MLNRVLAALITKSFLATPVFPMLPPCNMRGDRAHPILADGCLTPYRNQVEKECFSGKSIPALLAVKIWEQPQEARKGTKSHIALPPHGPTPSLCLLPLSLYLYSSLPKALVSKGITEI